MIRLGEFADPAGTGSLEEDGNVLAVRLEVVSRGKCLNARPATSSAPVFRSERTTIAVFMKPPLVVLCNRPNGLFAQ